MRKIPGYSNYLAGDDGKVYRLWHYGKPLNPPLELKSFKNPCGYLQCGAIADSDCPPMVGKPRREGRLVHHLICLAFHGLPPERGWEVDHINYVRDDNRPENLRWVSTRENRVGRRVYGAPKGEKHPAAKLTESQAQQIRSRRMAGEKLRTIAEDFGISLAVVSKIGRGELWKVVDLNAENSIRPPRV